jgi:hypothetical protein
MVSLFSLIAFYMNQLYAASDQNESKKKSRQAAMGAPRLCAHDRARGFGWPLGLARNVSAGGAAASLAHYSAAPSQA